MFSNKLYLSAAIAYSKVYPVSLPPKNPHIIKAIEERKAAHEYDEGRIIIGEVGPGPSGVQKSPELKNQGTPRGPTE